MWSLRHGANKFFKRSAATRSTAFIIYYLLFENRRLCLMNPIVKYKKLDARAVVPQYATPGAAAADLCAVLDTPLTLAPMQRALVPTGLAIELPGPACVALVYARSGLSIKHGLCMANGGGGPDRKSTRLNSSHPPESRMPSSA